MDLALEQQLETGNFDLGLAAGDVATDGTLRTAVVLSLFTDRRAEDDDTVPDGTGNRRGWWSDALRDQPFGSRLWLLEREKELPSVLRRAEEYAREALEWMVADGVASRVEVEAWNVNRGVLGLRVAIFKPDGDTEELQFEHVWDAFTGGVNGL